MYPYPVRLMGRWLICLERAQRVADHSMPCETPDDNLARSSNIRRRFKDHRLFGKFICQRCRSGERKPDNESVQHSVRNKECERNADPDAEAIKAVHQLTPVGGSKPATKARNHSPRAIFSRQQM